MTGFRTAVAAALLLSAACVAACVEVPDSVRAHFADPRADEPNNFRKGRHGTARPDEDAPSTGAVAAREAGPFVAQPVSSTPSTATGAAPASAASVAAADGGTP